MDRAIPKRKWPPKKIAFVTAAGALILLVVWSVVTATRGMTLRVNGERVRIEMVEKGEFQEFVPVVGTVIPITTHYLDAVEGGVVEAIYREAGSLVEKGDEILKLTNTSLLLDIMNREAELFQQSNNLRNTNLAMEQNRLEMRRELLEISHEIARQKRIKENMTRLMDGDLVSRREFEESRDELDYLLGKRELLLASQGQDSLFRMVQVRQLEESLARIQVNLDVVKQNMKNLVIRAPVSGQLTALNAEIGQSKGRGERLGQVDVLDGFKLRAAIDQHYIARIALGLKGTFSFAGRAYCLTIHKVYPEVVNGRFEIDLHFSEEEPDGIRRGQTFHVRMELSESKEAVVLPNGPFYQTTGGGWIYVLDSSGERARKRDVALGRQNTEYLEVLSGLEPGDRVITSSYERFGDADELLLE